MAPQRVIIDTDPGVDDVLALLLALSSKPEELEVLLLSVTYGNVGVQACLKNVVAVFHFIEKEQEWRRQNGRPEDFETLKACKPIVAIGAEGPLGEQLMMADYFHGTDGLQGVYTSHPHLSPADTWKTLFQTSTSSESAVVEAIKDQDPPKLFTPSNTRSHLEILRLLRENPPQTITIVAIGPLTNVAQAAATDPETFLRVKEVVVMGGALAEHGNVTPVAEFNCFADSVAAARVFALTSPNPFTTMPPSPPSSTSSHPPFLAPYPSNLSRQLPLTLFPLDITHQHHLTKSIFDSYISRAGSSPLAEWVSAFMAPTFAKIISLSHSTPGLALHDPLCIWYLLNPSPSTSTPSANPWRPETTDIRIETTGQWTQGSMIIDRRDRNRRQEVEGAEIAEVAGDSGNWLSARAGNRVSWVRGSPGVGEVMAGDMLGRIFGIEWGGGVGRRKSRGKDGDGVSR